MDTLLQQFNNNKILKNAAWALTNFVNVENYRKIFLKENYINDLIVVLKRSYCYEVMNELLLVILNLLDAVNETEIFSFIGSKIVESCCELFIFELAARINSLERKGWIFSKPRETIINSYGESKTFVRYSIIKRGEL
jgi:hypothetical protein